MNKSKKRFAALDELRALAVLSMTIAHFAPGLVERVSVLQPFSDLILVTGRLSTVAFIIVFGLTLGFIQLPKCLAGRGDEVVRWLYARARLVAICSVIIVIPAFINLWLRHEENPVNWAFSSYSILNYYVFALLSAPFWLLLFSDRSGLFKSSPERIRSGFFLKRGLLLAGAYWLTGLALLSVWTYDMSRPAIEFTRMHLISGGYAYLPLAAFTIAAIPAGYWMVERHRGGKTGQLVLVAVTLGALLAGLGFVLGTQSGEMTLKAIADGSVKGPPRFWYWCLFGGITLVLLSIITLAHHWAPGLSRLTWPLGLFGQASLGIYTSHTWVLPIVNWSDAVVEIEGPMRAVFALGIFGCFCALAMLFYARKNRRGGRANVGGDGTLMAG